MSTIEIDATLAQRARASLTAAGYTPTVITGGGGAGYPAGASYDRIIATASVRPGELPYPWVTQTRPGGIIVTPRGRGVDSSLSATVPLIMCPPRLHLTYTLALLAAGMVVGLWAVDYYSRDHTFFSKTVMTSGSTS